MGGLAIMAWRLAHERTGWTFEFDCPVCPVDRRAAFFLEDREYYRIIDRLARGEKP